jgi:hypothetical protein
MTLTSIMLTTHGEDTFRRRADGCDPGAEAEALPWGGKRNPIPFHTSAAIVARSGSGGRIHSGAARSSSTSLLLAP